MKLVYAITILFCLSFMACGEDTSCTRADWAGTYVLQDSDCIDESFEFEDLIVIQEGMESNTIVIDGSEITFVGCDASAFGFAKLELNGSELKVKLEGGGCDGTYERN